MNPLPSQNLSVLGLGGSGLQQPSLIIPEANSQGYFTLSVSGNGTAGRSWPLSKDVLGVPYQVPGGKTLKIISVMFFSSTANFSSQIMSATSTFAANVAAPVGAVYQGGSSGVRLYSAITAFAPVSYQFPLSIAANLWPGIEFQDTGAMGLMAVCKEV